MNAIKDGIYHVYVGSYGNEMDEAVQMLEFDAKDGSLSKLASASGIKSPSYLTVNKAQTRLYSVSEVGNGEVVSFNVDVTKPTMEELNRQETRGNAPCYVTLDQQETHLLTVNYGEGTTTAHVLEQDGAIGFLSDLKLYVNEDQSHPHTIVGIPDTSKYIVTDLGLNKLYLYELDYNTSKLELINEVATVAASGPRHVAIASESRIIYVVNEFNSKISVYMYDKAVENLELIQEIETTPSAFKGENFCADIHLAHSKSILYASNRGHHSIAVFKILESGKLVLIGHVSTTGEWPRNFAVVPNDEYLLVANEHTNSIVIMKLDEDGIPYPTGNEYAIKAPVCLKIVPKK